MKMRVYNYRPELKILNTDQLPKGAGCTVLECIFAPDDTTLIAKQCLRPLSTGCAVNAKQEVARG